MPPLCVCVLARPGDKGLRLLDAAPEGVRFAFGTTPEAFAEVASQAEVIYLVSGGRALLEPVLARAPRVRWVHVGWAGLDGALFPALVESAIPVTNARGVFSSSLSEFVLASILFFAKDLRRMLANQTAGRWSPFDVEEIAGHSLGILGFGDIGRAVAGRAKAMGMRVLAMRRGAVAANADPTKPTMFVQPGVSFGDALQAIAILTVAGVIAGLDDGTDDDRTLGAAMSDVEARRSDRDR